MKIWKIVHQRHPDWTLNAYGDYGDQRDVLIPEIKKMDANIVLHDPTANIGEEYLKNSMLLLTSLYEPFGLVMPEAMSYGLPVVAFDCPYGPAEIITDGVDGFLIKDRNLEDFADKVCQLIEDEELRRSMGAAGIKSSQRFSAENIMPMWKDFFESI
jgi:glycosyltransferase involved in cell wall biosynthesis